MGQAGWNCTLVWKTQASPEHTWRAPYTVQGAKLQKAGTVHVAETPQSSLLLHKPSSPWYSRACPRSITWI